MAALLGLREHSQFTRCVRIIDPQVSGVFSASVVGFRKVCEQLGCHCLEFSVYSPFESLGACCKAGGAL